jgi:cephalosporin-C deacetylase-like acetyl esterase
LVTASLDTRLAAAVAEEPLLCNYPVAVDVTTKPYVELHDYLQAHPDEREAALATLATFDPLNLVDSITCPTSSTWGCVTRSARTEPSRRCSSASLR